MVYAEYSYVELIIGGYGNGKPRNNVVMLNQVAAALNKSNRVECYRSHYRFPAEFREYVHIESIKEHKKQTVSGYNGTAYTDCLWVDIDDQDLSIALAKAQKYIGRLEHVYRIPPEYLKCFFSGSKGFHIGILSQAFGFVPSRFLPQICKDIARELMGDIDFDEAIYDKTRLFRLSNTVNNKTGLYKVELTANEILLCNDIEVIKEKAKAPRQHISMNIDEVETIDEIQAIYQEVAKKYENGKKKQSVDSQATHWVSSLLENGAETGGRTSALIRLAGYYKKKGLPQDIARSLLTQWDITKNRPPLTGDSSYKEDKIDKAVADIYSYESEGQEESPAENVTFYNWQLNNQRAPEYIENISRSRITFGIPNIDKHSGGLGPGELCYIVGYTYTGKTALAQSIQLDVSVKKRIASVMFSLEMSAMRLYFRQLAMINGVAPVEIEEAYRSKDVSRYVSDMEKYDQMYIVDQVPLSVAMIGSILDNAPVPIDLVIVDYIGLLMENGSTPYERMTRISNSLVQMAKEKKVAIIGLVQTNRTGSTGPIDLSMSRDSGMVEADADMVVGLWVDPDNVNQRKIRLLKARHGSGSGSTDLLAFLEDSPRLYPLLSEDK